MQGSEDTNQAGQRDIKICWEGRVIRVNGGRGRKIKHWEISCKGRREMRYRLQK